MCLALDGIRRRAVLTNKRMTRTEMIKWLGDTISTETKKPFEDIDYDFVDECGRLLDELIDKSAAMSEDEIADIVENLKQKTTSTVWKKIKCGKLWKIAVVAAVVLCMSVTVFAIPELRVKLMNALQLDVGESIVENEITYIHSGETTYYTDIDSLISAENLDILAFEDPNGELIVTDIKYIAEISTTTISFNDPTVYIDISHNKNNITEAIINSSEKIALADFDVYILSKKLSDSILYNAYIFFENNTYVISCSSDSTVYTIINHLRKRD